ncbi:hypothetical protein ABVT39_000565 [Epinephelus coioides]
MGGRTEPDESAGGSGSTFGRNAMFGQRVTPKPSGPQRRQDSLTERACSSPTRFAVFIDSHLRSAWAKGSMGEEDKASSTRERSHAVTLGATGGRSLSAPLRKEDTNRWHPTVAFSIKTCRDEIAATYTLKVEGLRLSPRRDWRNSRMVATVQEAGSSPLPAHQAENLLQLHSYWRRVMVHEHAKWCT